MSPKRKNVDLLPKSIHSFFEQYLKAQCNVSPKTIYSYRDTIRQFLLFAAEQKGVHFSALQFSCFDVPLVLAFLDHIEDYRKVSISTRNHRLAILRSFFRHSMTLEPEYFQQCSRILNIPYKRVPEKPMDYLETDEMEALIAQPDRATAMGRRDYLILALMYNTGCRVDELVHIAPANITFDPPHYSVKISGKGRKTRICPLWEQTIILLKDFMVEHNVGADSKSRLFMNQRKQEMTRFGIFHMIRKYHKMAITQKPSLAKKKLHPHSIRHTTAVHLLDAGVELNVIQQILGHSSIETTNKYAKISMVKKRQAIETTQERPSTEGRWQKDENILSWLESL